MIASTAAIGALRPTDRSYVMDMPQEKSNDTSDSQRDLDTKRAIQDLLDVLPNDVLDEIKIGAIDLRDAAFLEGLVDHVSRLALANPKAGQKILPKNYQIEEVNKPVVAGIRPRGPSIVNRDTDHPTLGTKRRLSMRQRSEVQAVLFKA